PLKDVTLEQFCSIDDADVLMAIKTWCNHPDFVLSTLCTRIINRKILKVKYSTSQVADNFLNDKLKEVAQHFNISEEEAAWLVISGTTGNSTYNMGKENIHILFKDGSVKDIAEVDHSLISENVRGMVKKYYFCYIRI